MNADNKIILQLTDSQMRNLNKLGINQSELDWRKGTKSFGPDDMIMRLVEAASKGVDDMDSEECKWLQMIIPFNLSSTENVE
jgi:hypothetical protein